ncbi:hypothetical protein BC936DRAFT_141406 [Jimgerdemannia flammicorona]|uniref:Uncharacterized protein n=1 Tax=Jimgerdemannia flammicorona TaxID=994334 RepID=A0A433A2B5_9FUNG|nr:hypothetical protein BC936DRAFT_141406 [Jimgerdemannia flammicorona]
MHTDNPSPTQQIAWNEELSAFLGKIGLLETRKAFDTELLVLSKRQRDKLLQDLEQLVKNLLTYLEQVSESKEKDKTKRPCGEETVDDATATTNDPSATGTTPGTRHPAKRKRSMTEDDGDAKYRVEHLNPEQVQIRATNSEMKHRIDTFIQVKQAEIDASNRAEFLRRKDPSEDDITCARTDAREINRNIQMKFDVVNNEDGPLARSLAHGKAAAAAAAEEEQRGRRGGAGEMRGVSGGTGERLKNLEEHLSVRFGELGRCGRS